MAISLKQQTISGMIWSFLQRFGSMGVSFISNIIFARLLTPDDYGCIGMLTIFIALSNTFIDGGFGSALIQKKRPHTRGLLYYFLLECLFKYCTLRNIISLRAANSRLL